ncbi:MAG TPA: GGDEF domain-containing protein [Sphingomonas sp.]|jgi:diguanylate cyclase (GGDEF)-like protein|nr:GGDEF domain-containing protein [Sphingomonas sp.]
MWMRSDRLIFKPTRAVPEAVHAELVRHVVGGQMPVFVIGVTVAIIAAFLWHTPARWPGLVVIAGIAALLVLRFRLTASVTDNGEIKHFTPEEARTFDRRYTRVMLPYAALMSSMNVIGVLNGDAALWIVVAAEAYGFCAGHIARGVARPRLCAETVMIVAVPTALAFITKGFMIDAGRTSAALCVVGAMVALYSIAGMETIAYNYRNILSQIESKRHLSGLARLDALTGLPNRLSLHERLELAFADGKDFALHLIDLDGFKVVNDTHGHPKGDRLLSAVAVRLSQALRAGDTVYRLGGDEFALIQHGIASRDEMSLLARRVVRMLANEFMVDDLAINIGGSVGTAMAPADAASIDELIERSDVALYAAKAAGKGTSRAWSPSPAAAA